jgi:hypothetical protein
METVEINKNRYSNQQYRQVIDTTFSELKNSEEPLSLDKFFSDFDKIFLDIPVEGDKSLRSIFFRIDSILNQGIDPKDTEIENLLSQVDKLQEEINKLKSSNEEESHPLFENGKLLLDTSSGKKFIMERGKKRQIMDGDTMKVLIQLNGGKADTPFQEVCVQLPPSIVNGIEDGIPINDSNFNLSESTIDEDVQKEIWNRDWSDPSLNLNWVRSQYSYDEYIEILNRDLNQKASVIEYVEDQIDLRRNNLSQLRFVDDEPRKEELRNEISDLNSTLESVETRESEVAQALRSLLNNPSLYDEADSEQSQSQFDGDNPDITYSVLKNNLETLFNEGFLEKNDLDALKKGLRQAKEERDDNPRSAQRWIADIDKKNSGKKQRDLFLVIDKTKDEINANPNSDGTI